MDHQDYIETCLGDGSHALSLLVGDGLHVPRHQARHHLTQVAKSITPGKHRGKPPCSGTPWRDFLTPTHASLCSASTQASMRNRAAAPRSATSSFNAMHLPRSGHPGIRSLPADDFFPATDNEFDGVMAMYHDQAAIPFPLQQGWRSIPPDTPYHPYSSQHPPMLLYGRLQRGRCHLVPSPSSWHSMRLPS